MSENLDLARSICTPWEHGDFRAADWAHPDIEFVMADRDANIRGSTGVAAMVENFGDFLRTWEDYRLYTDEYRELDEERVLVLNRPSARSKTSGLDLGCTGTRTANLFHLRNGKVTRIVIYADRDRALADLGLKDAAYALREAARSPRG